MIGYGYDVGDTVVLKNDGGEPVVFLGVSLTSDVHFFRRKDGFIIQTGHPYIYKKYVRVPAPGDEWLADEGSSQIRRVLDVTKEEGWVVYQCYPDGSAYDPKALVWALSTEKFVDGVQLKK